MDALSMFAAEPDFLIHALRILMLVAIAACLVSQLG